MDPNLINAFVAVSLIILTLSLLLMVSAAIPLISQASRTLFAYERLADTVETEIKPTLLEVKEAVEGFNQFRSLTAKRVNEVGHTVEDVAGSVGHAAKDVTKSSSVFGAGLIAGIKHYLEDKEVKQFEAKQISSKQLSNVQGEGNG